MKTYTDTHIYIIYILIKIETDVGKGKENLSIIIILSRILALDMRQKLWDINRLGNEEGLSHSSTPKPALHIYK